MSGIFSIGSIKAQTGEIKSLLTTLEGNIEDNQVNITLNSKVIDSLSEEVSEVQSKMSGSMSEVEELKDTINSLTSELENLKARVGSIKYTEGNVEA